MPFQILPVSPRELQLSPPSFRFFEVEDIMISGSAIATLVLFFISIVFVIQAVKFHIPLPYLGSKRISINLTTAPILTILILWASQCIGPSVIRNGIVGTDGVKPYNILILFFSLAYMAITLDITGILKAAAFWVSNKGGSNGWKLFLYFYIMLTVLSIVLGNDPVILSGTAFLVYYTKANKLDHRAWIMSEFAAANTASMVLFVGNPTNVVICEGFSINNAAFTAYTILPFLACSITCFFALASQFHKKKYIPKKLDISGDLDVRSVLLDPTGAWVGSILLGSCLVVIIIVSFFHVDVWKISLPFAVAKFLFDIGWDYYRLMKGIETGLKGSDSSADLTEAEDDIVQQQLGQQHMKHSTTIPEESISGPGIPFSQSPRTGTPDVEEKADSRVAINRTKSGTRADTDTTLVGTVQEVSEKVAGEVKPTTESDIHWFHDHFPTIYTAFPRLPFALIPFAFSQFILIEGLAHQGWIEIFARWLVIATDRLMYPTIWVVGVLGVLLCNLSGTNIGATILLTKVIRAASLSTPANSDVNLDAFNRAAGISLAVASNIGAVSFTFSASLAGLLWKAILNQKGIKIKQLEFAMWNLAPLAVMTGVGMAVVCAEMAVLF